MSAGYRVLERMSNLMKIVNRNAQGMGFLGNKQELEACLASCAELLNDDWLTTEDWDKSITGDDDDQG